MVSYIGYDVDSEQNTTHFKANAFLEFTLHIHMFDNSYDQQSSNHTANLYKLQHSFKFFFNF